MTLLEILREFAHDKQVTLVAILIAADLVFGLASAVKTKTFNLTWLVAFGKDDLVAKVLPWLMLFTFGKATSGSIVAGIDFGTVADAFFVGVSAALVGSLLGSFAELGIPLPSAVSGKLLKPHPGQKYLPADGDQADVTPEP